MGESEERDQQILECKVNCDFIKDQSLWLAIYCLEPRTFTDPTQLPLSVTRFSSLMSANL